MKDKKIENKYENYLYTLTKHQNFSNILTKNLASCREH